MERDRHTHGVVVPPSWNRWVLAALAAVVTLHLLAGHVSEPVHHGHSQVLADAVADPTRAIDHATFPAPHDEHPDEHHLRSSRDLPARAQGHLVVLAVVLVLLSATGLAGTSAARGSGPVAAPPPARRPGRRLLLDMNLAQI